MRFRPYLGWFRLELKRSFTYRTNFVFGRVREIVVYLALGYLFIHATSTGALGPYDRGALLAYAATAAWMSTVLFTFGMHRIAAEIADGDLVNYLLRPIRYPVVWVSRLASDRALLLVAGAVELGIFVAVFRPQLPGPSAARLLATFATFLGALAIVQLLDLLAGSLGFWTHRSHGPRWLTTILIQFCSGAYLPLDLLPSWVQHVLSVTPFPSLIHVPVRALLGVVTPGEMIHTVVVQAMWIVALVTVFVLVWRRGVRSYAAYGR